MESTPTDPLLDTSTMDLVAGGVCVLVLIAIVIGLFFWVPKILAYGQEASASEQRFLNETIRDLTGEPPPPPGFSPVLPSQYLAPAEPAPQRPAVLPIPPEEAPPPLPSVPPPFPPAAIPASAPAAVATEGDALQRLAERLTQLGIVDSFEGRIPLAIPPTGLIYRLKRGGSCALLPRLEAADVMEHMTRRFDMVFVVQGADNVLVVERLAQRAKDFVQMGTGQRG